MRWPCLFRLPPHAIAGLTACLTLAVALAGCDTSTSVSTLTGPSPPKCQIAVNAPPPMGPAGGQGTLTVLAAAECAWRATSQVDWITALSPATGQGDGEVRFQVAPNGSPAQRQGDISLGGVQARVTQAAAACTYQVSPDSHVVPAGGGQRTFAVSTMNGCAWSATTGEDWLSPDPDNDGGNASGTVIVNVASNTGGARSGALTIAGRTVTVAQAGTCATSISPDSASVGAGGGSGSVAVTTASDCDWTAASSAPWLTITSETSGTGNGTVAYSAAANNGGARSGVLAIAGHAFTVTQAAAGSPTDCTITLNPTTQTVAAAGGPGAPIGVTTAATCAWTAVASVSWISLAASGPVMGNGSIAFTVAANGGGTRTGAILVNGVTHAVTQTGQTTACSISIAPPSYDAPAGGGAGAPITVTATAGCPWTASTADDWITITAGSGGTGNGSVEYTVAANSGPTRSGAIVVAGQTFAIAQAAGTSTAPPPPPPPPPPPDPTACTYTVTPPSFSVGDRGGRREADLVTGATCAWTALSNVLWIVVHPSNRVGIGPARIRFDVTRNRDDDPRQGTVTVATQAITVTQAGEP